MRDGSGWVHCRAARLTLGVIFVCVNVGACAALITSSELGVMAQTSQRLTSNPTSFACGLFFCVVCVDGCLGCLQALP